MNVLIQSIIDGILFGAIYAIAGVTFGIIYNITKAFHIAFGAIATLGTFVAVSFAGNDGGALHLVGSVVVGMVVSGLATAIVVAFIYQPLVRRGADNGAIFISSLACALIIQAIILLIFGPNNRSFPVDEFVRRFTVGTFGMSTFHGVSMLLALGVISGLALLLYRTRFGHYIRAIASNREQAELVGIRTNLVATAMCALAGGLSTLAAILFGMNSAVVSTGGTQLALFAILATLAGNAGGILGVASVGIAIGFLGGVFGALLPGQWSMTVVFAFTLCLILVRPFHLIKSLLRRRMT